MKINSLTLTNYKKFRGQPKTISFKENINLIIGNNGIGKTTILQAISSILGTATQELKKPSMLKWSGYNYELIKSARTSPEAELSISFTDSELASTQDFYRQVSDTRNVSTPPSNEANIVLRLDYEHDTVNAGSSNRFFQFRGYAYAKQLAVGSSTRNYFDNVGNIFWYTEERNNTSFKRFLTNGKESSIRDFLVSIYRFHQRVRYDEIQLREGQKDIFEDLSRLYSQVFEGRTLSGTVPRSNPTEAFETDWFYLSDGTNQYEVSEMSAGERAIFPILVDFANLNINNSIVIIDEIELHLHPPLQQAFLRALPKLGHNNQFIITTHSDYVPMITDESQIIRL